MVMALLLINLIYNNSMPYFDKNKDQRKKHRYLEWKCCFYFLQKWHNNSIDKKGSGELSFFVPKRCRCSRTIV